MLDGKKYRLTEKYSLISKKLHEFGCRRTAQQLQEKIKALRRDFTKVKKQSLKKQNNISGNDKLEYLNYELFKDIYGNRGTVTCLPGVQSGKRIDWVLI